MSRYAPIDVHAHYFPQSFLDLIAKHGPSHGFEYKMVEGKGPQFKHGHLITGPVGPKFVDLDARLEAMDEQGVEVHALSLSQPMVYWADGELAQGISESYNDALAQAHERHPKRLVGLATLPMHEPALAVKEVERAAKLPGMRGFYIATQIRGKDVSDTSFLPVYERIEASGLPLCLHPVEGIGPDRVLMAGDYCFPIAYEQPVKIVADHPSLDAEAKRKIVEVNARHLLKL